MNDQQPHPWDKLPSESTRWYSRFIKFRDLGSDRTIYKAYCFITKSQKKPGYGAPGAWKEAAEKFNWNERAQAWDLAQIRKLEEDLQERQQKEIEAEMEDARIIRDKGRAILEKLPLLLDKDGDGRILFPASATEYNAARAMISEAAKLSRMALNMPLETLRLDNLNIDLTNLSDDQIERLAKGENAISVLASARTSRARAEKAGESAE